MLVNIITTTTKRNALVLCQVEPPHIVNYNHYQAVAGPENKQDYNKLFMISNKESTFLYLIITDVMNLYHPN